MKEGLAFGRPYFFWRMIILGWFFDGSARLLLLGGVGWLVGWLVVCFFVFFAFPRLVVVIPSLCVRVGSEASGLDWTGARPRVLRC